MSITNDGIIIAPVTIPDLQKVLGSSSRSVTYLCKSANIRKYSRYKPYAFGGILPNGLYGGKEIPTTGSPREQILKDNNFGMTPTEMTMPPRNQNYLGFVPTAWKTWRPPSGLKASPTEGRPIDEPCRMGDFLGYDPNAKSYLEKLEVFGNLDSLTPVRNGMIGVRLTINTKTGSSILPSEFTAYEDTGGKMQSIELGKMHLTMVLANLYTRADFIIAQSDKTLEDAAFQSFIDTNTGKGTIEVSMDLSKASSDQIDDIHPNNDQYMLLAVGLAKKWQNKSGYFTETVGDATYIHDNNADLNNRNFPFAPFINVNMWGENWKVATITNVFQVVEQEIVYDLPCNLVAYGSGSISSGNGNINVNLAGDYEIRVPDNITGDAAKYSSVCNLGLDFRVDIKTTADELLYSSHYGLFMSDGYNSVRSANIKSSGITFYPAFSYGETQKQSQACEYFGINQVPADGIVRIPYNGNESKLKIEVYCSVICFPYREPQLKFVYPQIVARSGGSISQTLNSKTITIS